MTESSPVRVMSRSLTALKAAAESDDQRPVVLSYVTNILSLFNVTVPANRLNATISVYDNNTIKSTNNRSLMLNKIKARYEQQHPQAIKQMEAILAECGEQGGPIDRIIAIVGHLMTAHQAAQSNAQATTTAAPIVPARAQPAASSASASASASTLSAAVAVPSSAPSSPAPALSAAPTLAHSHSGGLVTKQPANTTTTTTNHTIHPTQSAVITPAPLATPHSTPSHSTILPRHHASHTERKEKDRIRDTERKEKDRIRDKDRETRRNKVDRDSREHRDAEGTEEKGRDGILSSLNSNHAAELSFNTSFALPSATLPSTSSSLPSSSMLARSASDADLIDLCYGSQIILKLCTSTYAALDDDAFTHSTLQTVTSSAAGLASASPAVPTYMHVRGSSPYPFTLTIYNAKNTSDRSPIRFLDCIVLAADGQLLLPNRHGELVASTAAALTATAATAVKWVIYSGKSFLHSLTPPAKEISTLTNQALSSSTLLPPSNDPPLSFLSIRGPVKNGDDIILKCSTGLYLSFRDDEQQSLTVVERPTSEKEVLRMYKAHLPIQAGWIQQMAELPQPDTITTTPTLPAMLLPTSPSSESSLSSQSLSVQEQWLIEDLLYALLGLEGDYVKLRCISHSTPSSISPTIPVASARTGEYYVTDQVKDLSLVSILHRLLPVCNDYHFLHHYLLVHSRYEYGCIHHALSNTLAVILKEYTIMIVQLEVQPAGTPPLTLLRMWYHLQSSAQTLHQLSNICAAVAHQIGGEVLNTLHTLLLHSGDHTQRSLLLHLLSHACVPYFDMLTTWLYTGVIVDRYDEFYIHSNEEISSEQLRQDFNDTYWNSRWMTSMEKCPAFLLDVQEKILTTGKYVNVCRECKAKTATSSSTAVVPLFASQPHTPLVYSEQSTTYHPIINAAYTSASADLLSLLLHDHHLLDHLSCIKRYFFCAQGDWLLHFFDLAEQELQKNIHIITRQKLNNLLEVSIRSNNQYTSSSSSTSSGSGGSSSGASRTMNVTEHITCYLQPHSLLQKIMALHSTATHTPAHIQAQQQAIQHHTTTGISAFTLSYTIHYPLTLLLSKTTLTKYQLIFRLLFQLKFLERQLSAVWLLQKNYNRRSSTAAISTATITRHHMQFFIQNLLYFLMIEILEPAYQQMIALLSTVQTSVDAVFTIHIDYLNVCLKHCGLTDIHMLTCLTSVLERIQAFCTHVQQPTAEAAAAETVVSGEIEPQQNSFDEKVLVLLRVLREKSVQSGVGGAGAVLASGMNSGENYLGNLLTRLDYNGYFSAAETEKTNIPRHM